MTGAGMRWHLYGEGVYHCDDGGCTRCPYCVKFYAGIPATRPHPGPPRHTVPRAETCDCIECYRFDRWTLVRGSEPAPPSFFAWLKPKSPAAQASGVQPSCEEATDK